ncbi:hypothetical protein RV12_GL000975 [Enterococcus quebecensis]|nr:hypothetical protein RV12_GL000975 [Enterococcus quebecensis]
MQLPSIGKPATNALKSNGYTTLEQVRTLDKATLLKMHGVGPKAITILEKALAEHNWTFQDSSLNKTMLESDFEVICSLNCDNAPKRRLIRDYLIALASGNQQFINSILADSFRLIIPGRNTLNGKEMFIRTILKEQKEIRTLHIQSILTHGKEGSTHGIITTKTGNIIYFSAIIRFVSNQKEAPISEVTAFMIQ